MSIYTPVFFLLLLCCASAPAGEPVSAVDSGTSLTVVELQPLLNTPEQAAEFWAERRRIEEPISARLALVRAEIADITANPENHPEWAREWAGEYNGGDGVSIVLAPKAGLVYILRGCLGLADHDFGTIEEVLPDRVRLSLERSRDDGSIQLFDTTLLLVKWGKARILVQEHDVVNFCNQASNLSRRTSSTDNWQWWRSIVSGAVNREDTAMRLEGPIVIPTEYSRFLAGDHIETRIAELTDLKLDVEPDSAGGFKGSASANIILEAGSVEGVQPRYRFSVVDKGNREDLILIYVRSVEEHRSTAALYAYFWRLPSSDVESRIPKVGTRVSTRRR